MRKAMRLAEKTDSRDILEIYAPYIKDTAITFEIEVPTIDDFSRRIDSISKKYPFIVYQVDEKIIGYAYASEHMERAAYRYDIDVSIYIEPRYHGSGVAYQLYDKLFYLSKELGYVNAYAGITVPNEKSFKFHHKYDFKLIGTYCNIGYKLGIWHDVSWLGKTINPANSNPCPLKLVTELPEDYLNNVLSERKVETT